MTRVLIAAFDGLLPQQVTADLTPNIHSLATKGVRFNRHHAVYPTVTRVNSAAMVTGCYPGKHGIPANSAVFSDHDPHSAMSVLQPELAAMASNPDTPVLFVPTIGELLASTGLTHVSVVGGSSGNAYVHFPQADRAGRGGLIHPEFSLPVELGATDAAALGPWPGASVPGIERIGRVRDSVNSFVVPEINPDVLFTWFPEPDGANHAHGVGSDPSNRGLAEADAAFGKVLETLADRGDEPDVFVISDHGYSTISTKLDVYAELEAASFPVDRGEGSVLVGNNGGSILFNYPGADQSAIERFSTWLMSQPWAGAVFSSLDQAVELGALPVEAGFMDGTRAPHFVVSMAWDHEPGSNGFTGTAWNSGGSPVGAGLHGSASPNEIRNTLIASGPSFGSGSESAVPSGNIDLAPTVLHLLGIDAPAHMDGRVLKEALADDDGPDAVTVEEQTQVFGEPIKADGNVDRYVARHVSIEGHVYLESAGPAKD